MQVENNDIYWESSIPLCNTHTHTRVHTEVDKYTNSSAHVYAYWIETVLPVFSVQVDSVCVWLANWKLTGCLCVTCGT